MGDEAVGMDHSEIVELGSQVSCAYGRCGKPIADGAQAMKGDGVFYCSQGCAMLAALVDGGGHTESVTVKYKVSSL